MRLDSYDRAILSALQKDSSISNLDLSKLIGLSTSACLTRTKNLKELGVIKQFTTIVDERKLGMETIAFIMVILSPLNRETADFFLEQINKLPQVLECYSITGNKDYLLKIVAKDMPTYKDFVIDSLMAIPGVSRVETSIVINTEKRTLSIPTEE
ncbi:MULTISPECIES: Lrp/AsnC family transcriptional regulator [Pelosinus]|jgi:Lrp/AsnC family leucine-responsive transcriptional regulator|uniref:Transcriptional regulator, AsnC family n=2 Tax=Pelosinus TaxID=365348 RepID=I9NWI2_9FIRM|nr:MULTISPECIES: Lrp/AsnC family transcriptional regulator [Pelosinus]AJQ25399.1 transcriptional regulator, AsnC family [Pelosinus fermentans JBW45]